VARKLEKLADRAVNIVYLLKFAHLGGKIKKK
jgi:phosphate uptake regulator